MIYPSRKSLPLGKRLRSPSPFQVPYAAAIYRLCQHSHLGVRHEITYVTMNIVWLLRN